MSRTIIIGMNNPLSRDPDMALYPHPVNCTGWRLWKMLNARNGATQQQYLRGFERHNLVSGQSWEPQEARARAEYLITHLLGSRRVIVLGASVRTAFRLPPVLVKPTVVRGVTFRQLPHPSGRCRWYHDPKHRAIAGMLLEEEYAR